MGAARCPCPLRKAAHVNAQDWIGYTAAALTTGSFVPQALHTLRTRDVSGISLAMYATFTVGIALWLAYGLLLGDWPIVIANTVTLGLATTILVTKIVVDRGAARSGSPGRR
jgi:MtN3 and saliva related transmembrane protein